MGDASEMGDPRLKRQSSEAMQPIYSVSNAYDFPSRGTS